MKKNVYIYIYVKLIHFAVQQKLTQHHKVNYTPIKIKNKKHKAKTNKKCAVYIQ